MAPQIRDLKGAKVFKKKLSDYQYFVINYRSKIISSDNLALILSLSGSHITLIGILGANRMEDLLVARKEIVSSLYIYTPCVHNFIHHFILCK